MFVTLEGIDRSGKSTQARMLADALGPDCLAVREPGGTAVGEQVRALVKDPAATLSARAEALLFAAARTQLAIEVIEPALARGQTVVCDRFLDSSIAYQGTARKLGVEEVRAVNRFGLGTLTPDLTILFDLEPGAAFERSGDPDRFEAEGLEFQSAVAQAYRDLARAEPERWRVLDGARPPEVVHADVLAAIHGV